MMLEVSYFCDLMFYLVLWAASDPTQQPPTINANASTDQFVHVESRDSSDSSDSDFVNVDVASQAKDFSKNRLSELTKAALRQQEIFAALYFLTLLGRVDN